MDVLLGYQKLGLSVTLLEFYLNFGVTFGPFVTFRLSPLKFKGFWPVGWTERALLEGSLFQTMSLAVFLRYHHRTFLQFTADSQQIYRIENWKAQGNMGICIKRYEVEKCDSRTPLGFCCHGSYSFFRAMVWFECWRFLHVFAGTLSGQCQILLFHFP